MQACMQMYVCALSTHKANNNNNNNNSVESLVSQSHLRISTCMNITDMYVVIEIYKSELCNSILCSFMLSFATLVTHPPPPPFHLWLIWRAPYRTRCLWCQSAEAVLPLDLPRVLPPSSSPWDTSSSFPPHPRPPFSSSPL